MAHKVPKGRKASDEARSSAAALVAAYGPAIPAKEAALALLAALEHFVETGWLPDLAGGCSMNGRRASDEAREAATGLLHAYGPALRNLSGTFCVNPEADPEDQVIVSAEQAAYALLDTMNRLADTGWLVETEVALERLIIREYFYKVIRPEPGKTKVPLQKLSQKYHRSPRDLERMIRKTKS